MSNFNINNTLAELEDNLKKMDSARSQVSNLSQLVRQLTEAYSETLGQLKKIESSIHYDEKYFKNKFGKSIKELDNNIALLNNKVQENNNSLNSIYEKSFNDFVRDLDGSEQKIKKYVDSLSLSLDIIKNDFRNKNNEIVVCLNNKVKELVDITSSRIDEIKKLDLLKEINNIDQGISHINTYFERILSENNELKAQLEDLKKSQMEQSNKLESKINIVLILVVITLVGFFILKFV